MNKPTMHPYSIPGYKSTEQQVIKAEESLKLPKLPIQPSGKSLPTAGELTTTLLLIITMSACELSFTEIESIDIDFSDEKNIGWC